MADAFGHADMPPPTYVERGRYRIAYSRFGDPSHTPLVICHGLGAEGAQFRADAEWFAARGFFVLVPDLRGHGRSVSPASRSDADFTLAELAGDLIAMLDAEKIATTHWVGNSLGGILGLELVETAPERVLSLVTFGTAQNLEVPAYLPILSEWVQILAGRRLTALVTARMTSSVPAARRLIRSILERIDRDAVMRVARNLRNYDLRQPARLFGKPMLMLRGSQDRNINAVLGPSLANMKDRDNFRLVDIEGAGHCANLDRPEAVRAEILAFLEPDA